MKERGTKGWVQGEARGSPMVRGKKPQGEPGGYQGQGLHGEETGGEQGKGRKGVSEGETTGACQGLPGSYGLFPQNDSLYKESPEHA